MAEHLNAVVAGLAVGSVYGLVALGYTVVYAATRVFNLAQGNLLTVGVLLAYYLLAVQGWSWCVALPAIAASVAVISVMEERMLFRPPLHRAYSIGWFITTLA